MNNENLSAAVPTDMKVRLFHIQFWKSLNDNQTFCAQAENHEGVKLYVKVRGDVVIEHKTSAAEDWTNFIGRFEQVESKKKSKMWKKIKMNEIPQPSFDLIDSELNSFKNAN